VNQDHSINLEVGQTVLLEARDPSNQVVDEEVGMIESLTPIVDYYEAPFGLSLKIVLVRSDFSVAERIIRAGEIAGWKVSSVFP